MVSVIQRTTVALVGKREYVWDDRGRATARTARVPLEEAEEAANAPPGLRWEQRLDDLVMIIAWRHRPGGGCYDDT
jgi:hypothetical protein